MAIEMRFVLWPQFEYYLRFSFHSFGCFRHQRIFHQTNLISEMKLEAVLTRSYMSQFMLCTPELKQIS